MPPRKVKTVEPTFEEGLQKLEKMAEQMEQNQCSLDEMLTQYQEGIKLSNMLRDKLEKAQADIQLVMAQGDLQSKPVPFEHQPSFLEDET